MQQVIDDWKEQARIYKAERDAAQATVARLEAILKRVIPEVAVCPDCGPYVPFDEDGCCGACGTEVSYIGADAAIAEAKGETNGTKD